MPEAPATVATTRLPSVTPVLELASYEDAVTHYVDWLGFHLDREWRTSADRPVEVIGADGSGAWLLDAAEEARRDALRELMRDTVRRHLERSEGLPTVEELVEAVGRPIGIAIDVLAEFAESTE